MAETISRKSIVYDITFRTENARKAATDTGKAMDNLTKKADTIGSSFSNLGKQIAGAFALQEAVKHLSQFTQEAFELGLKAEGVRKAFDKLNSPSLLAELRKATKGTVDDLTLMQAAVKADKFKIPLTNLAQYLKFARQRAKETGEEVQQLVDTLIEGVGKQAAGRLDDLGLSTKELQKEFAITGDFAKATSTIISREMKDSSDDVLSSAEKVERLRTSWQNFKLEVGESLVGAIDPAQRFLEPQIEIFKTLINPAGRVREEMEKIAAAQKEVQQGAKQAGESIFGRLTNTALNTTAFSLAEINQRLKELNEEFERATDPKIQQQLAGQIQAFQKMKKAIEDLLTAAPAGSIKSLEKQISDLQEALSVTPNKDPAFQRLTAQITKLSEELDRVKNKFTDITRLNKILTSDVETSTEQLARQFYAVGQAIDTVTEDVRIAQSEFIKLSDGTMIKGLQENTIKGMREILEEQKKLTEEARTAIISSAANIFGDLSTLASEGSQAQIALSIANIFAANAEALANGISKAMTLPFPGNIAAAATTIATVTSMFVQVNSLLSKAKGASAAANAEAFAEGEVDIHRPGEQRGKDSIPAVIMPGESVLTTKRTKQYKPLIQAIHDGNVDDLIRVNYVEPALALNALNSKVDGVNAPDYTDKFYRQFLVTSEGNMTSKRMVQYLASIDKKLATKSDRYSH